MIFVSVIELLRQTKQGGWLIVSFSQGGHILTTYHTFLMTVHEKNSNGGHVRYDLDMGDCLEKI